MKKIYGKSYEYIKTGGEKLKISLQSRKRISLDSDRNPKRNTDTSRDSFYIRSRRVVSKIIDTIIYD